jgi:hypothetical protein
MGIKKGKEADLAIRRKLTNEISKSRENFNNILEELYEEKASKSINAVKKTMDELELFSNDITLSETGHKYAWFSPQVSIDQATLEKITSFDNSLISNLRNVTKASNKIVDLLIEDKKLNVTREMKKIRQYITDARNEYKNRIEFIKGLR